MDENINCPRGSPRTELQENGIILKILESRNLMIQLKKITASFIASKFSEKEVERLGIMFKQVDTNHDGSISIDELKSALDNQKEQKSYQELKEIIEGIDTDKNGQINYTEFLASSIETAKIFTKENLSAVFKLIDRDGNGFVDKN